MPYFSRALFLTLILTRVLYAVGSWKPISSVNAPAARSAHTAIWTGETGIIESTQRMIVWGGEVSFGAPTPTGGLYDSRNDTWRAVSLENAPRARSSHTALWTGDHMIVWGGRGAIGGDDFLNSGGIYNPELDFWLVTNLQNAPSRRRGHTAIWTGNEMIVWGGEEVAPLGITNSGGIYDPKSDQWRRTTAVNAPAPRAGHTAIWTGDHMIVWGGSGQLSGSGLLNSGGIYDPRTDSWTALSTENAPSARLGHTAVWTGESAFRNKMIVWGGREDSINATNTGGIYDPFTDTWIPTLRMGLPSARWGHTGVWTGRNMIIWGGAGYFDEEFYYFNSGGIDLRELNWYSTGKPAEVVGRVSHTGILTTRGLIVWGGLGKTGFLKDGAIFMSPLSSPDFSLRTFVSSFASLYFDAGV